ncbi:AAA family ATPase [Flavobacterium marginilacus]|uniref:AAA family ATPase n=1 Tax=Flavobacterium marginilacus TaxID=3003256 RepID=UPI00248E8C72|nr:AAA family ATPase [Flavobacterium marginilacus]
MIEKIEQIKDFGIYKDFNWTSSPNIKDFNFKNLFYGWNYSGKTTLSRIFSSLRDKKLHESYDKGTFKIKTSDGDFISNNLGLFPYELLVFNSDYIKDNLNFSIHKDNVSESKTILFEVGDNAKFEAKISDLKKKIDLINGTEIIIGKKHNHFKTIEEFEIFDKSISGKFTLLAKEIKNEHFDSIIDFTKANLKPIISKIKNDLTSHMIKDKNRLSQLRTIVITKEPKEELDEILFSPFYDEIIEKTNKILTNVPDKKHLDKILDSKSEIYSWVEEGLDYNYGNKKCLFCDNTIKEDRIKYLNEYFNSQASNLREKIEKLKEIILKEESNINSLKFPSSSNDLNSGYIDEYKTLKASFDKFVLQYRKHLKLILSKLTEKTNKSLYLNIDEIKKFDIEKLTKSISNINAYIIKNNDFTKGFQHRIQDERILYLNHLVATFLFKEKYTSKEKKHERSLIEIDKLNKLIKEYEKEIFFNESKKVSDKEGALQYTYFVQSFLNRLDIEIKLDTKTKKFILLRDNENASNLSEGEKTAIAFSHFLVTIKSLESIGKFKDYIVFVDDPISSLDGNHIFQINSLLKETFFCQIPLQNNPNQNQWDLKCKQLFISTHNFEFLNLMKELPTSNGYRYSKKDKSNESRYFIERRMFDSKILLLPKIYDSFASEYHYLFSEINKFNNEQDKGNSEKLLIIPNILRRFVEMYTLTKYPSDEPFDERAVEVFGKINSKRILKPLHYFSHFDNIDRIGKQSDLIADLPTACSTLIKEIKEKDAKHYKALLKAIN